MELDSISVRAQPNPEDNPKTNPETTKQESTVTCSPPEDESTASPPTEKATEEPSRRYPPTPLKIIIITALCLGTLLDAIDITIIGVAIPTISTHFHALDDVGWYGSAYLITLTALQPIFGVTYKFFNPKTIYLSSILVFEAGSIICASAPSSAVFILGRAICGCGGAGILQGALCIVALTVPLNKRALYLGIVVSSFGAAACFGPIMGGALTDRVSWRWCFWINLPVGAVVAGIIVLVLRLEGVEDGERALPLGKKLRRLDPVGACLLIASVCCLVLALQWGGSILPWRSAKVIGLLVGFGLLGIAFFVFEWRIGETAMLPMRVFGQRSVLMGCFYVCFLQMINDSDTYYMPFYFQAAQDASATLSGAKYLALIIPEIVTIVITGAIVSKTGYYVPYMIVGACIAAIGSGLLTRIALGTPTVEWASYLVISGLGIGLGLNLPYTALHLVLSEEDIPIGNGMTVLFGQLGGAIAVSVGQSTFLNSLLREVPKHVPTLSATQIIAVGATRLHTLTSNRDVLEQVKVVYAKAVANTMWLPVAAASAAAICACGMEWMGVRVGEKGEGEER